MRASNKRLSETVTVPLRSGGSITLVITGPWLTMNDFDFDFVMSIVTQLRAYQSQTEQLAVEDAQRNHQDGCVLWQFHHKPPCEVLEVESGRLV